MSVLLEICSTHDDVARDPEARVRFRTFGDSSLNFELLVWIAQPEQRGRVLHEINCDIYRSFAAAGIRIPFPQRDLHLHGSWPEAPGTGADPLAGPATGHGIAGGEPPG